MNTALKRITALTLAKVRFFVNVSEQKKDILDKHYRQWYNKPQKKERT